MRAGLLFAAILAGCSDYQVNGKPEDPVVDPVECTLVADTGEVAVDPACVVEPVVGTFSPVVEWRWEANPVYPGYDDIMSTPAVGNLNDDNGDGRIDDEDIPDVVFTCFSGGAYTSNGTLTAISGDGSGTLWSLLDAGGWGFHASGSPGIADIDADGIPEVCSPGTGVGLVCVEGDGTFKWAAGPEVYGYGSPGFADIDGDGMSEVVFGRTLLDTDGTVLWTGANGAGWWVTFATDLDEDGVQEVVAGNSVYEADGTLRWTDGTGDGPGAVGDFDLDGTPEIVHVSPPNVYLTDTDGTLLWASTVPNGGGGAPTVADFDGDGLPEVGVAGAYFYVVFDTDGALLWQAPVQDWSSSVTGSSVFDFEGDGRADVVYADEITLWVYDGATGAVKLQVDEHASGTLLEYPLIVDVDHDGATEIVLASNNYAYAGWNGITVIGDADGSWRPSRPTWNQFAYSITNVDDDGGVPAHPTPNWSRYNNFRAGGTTLGLSSELADLHPGTPETCLDECATGDAWITIPIENAGTADSTSFRVDVVTSDGTRITSQEMALRSGERRDLGPLVLTAASWPAELFVRIDDDDAVEECDEADNVASLGAFPCE